MAIDWFTVGAQTLNFLLLVWLLKRYLYEPILKAIDARERQIAKVITEADTIKLDAEVQRKLFEQKNTELNSQRDQLLTEAKKNARHESEKIVFQAHKSADEISTSRLLALEKELQHYQDNIAMKTLHEIYDVAGKVLADLADLELEQQMFACFCQHLQNISPDERNNLNKILKTANTDLLLSSAFELTAAQIKEIDMILQHITKQKDISTNANFQLEYAVKPKLISGIELRSNGWVIAWNSQNYLNLLQTHIDKLLTEERETINNRTLQLKTRKHSDKDPA